jgi:hypothetical protein
MEKKLSDKKKYYAKFPQGKRWGVVTEHKQRKQARRAMRWLHRKQRKQAA